VLGGLLFVVRELRSEFRGCCELNRENIIRLPQLCSGFG
jgi:hypothetical protein